MGKVYQLDCFCYFDDLFDEAIAVAPFVVVPGHNEVNNGGFRVLDETILG